MIIKNAALIDGTITDITIENGIISAIGKTGTNDARTIDAAGLTAIPGLVDMHIHMRYPGQTHKEDVMSASRAAAAGGVTSVLAMPNTTPAADSIDTIKDILSRPQCGINIYQAAAVSKGLSGAELTDMEDLAKYAAAFSDDGRPVRTAAMMARAMKTAQKLNRPVLSHAEELTLADGGIMFEGEISRKLGVRGIPAAAEAVAVARDVTIARCTGAPVHICHVSTRQSLDIIREAKADSVPVTCETAPHYFAFNHEKLLSRDAHFRMNPPLASEQDRLAVIGAIKDGTIDAIVTDHAPHSAQEKSDFEKAPNGVVGLETSFAASYTHLVKTGVITLSRLIGLMSFNPARLLNIRPTPIKEGSRADIALVDLNEQWKVEPDRFFSKGRSTPFAGEILTSKVKYTICAGRIIFADKRQSEY